MKRLCFLLTVPLCVLQSCQEEISSGNLLYTPPDQIRFVIDNVSTRAEAATADNIRSMAIFCYKGNSEFNIATDLPNHNFNERVNRPASSGSGEWVYANPEKGKWDKGVQFHSFFTFSPFEAEGWSVTSAPTDAGFPQASYTVPTDITRQADLLYAAKLNTLHYYMGNKPVPLNFRHALSKISFSAALNQKIPPQTDVKIKQITFKNLYSTGNVSFDFPADNLIPRWNFDRQTPGDFTASNTNGALADIKLTQTSQSISNSPLFLLPQRMDKPGDFSKLEVIYTLTQEGITSEMTKTYDLTSAGLPAVWETGKGYHYSLTYGSEHTLACSITDWDDVPVSGDIIGETLSVSKNRLFMDYESLGRRFDASVDYTADSPVEFVGYVTKYQPFGQDREVTTDGSNLPGWLPKDNIQGLPDGSASKGTIRVEYVIASTRDWEISLRIRAGNIIKDITVVYANGLLPSSVLAYPGQWTIHRPDSGLQIAKLGNKLPTEEADANNRKETMKWADGSYMYTVLAARRADFGHGPWNTDAIIRAHPSDVYTVAKRCRSLGPLWYQPSKDELEAISRVHDYLGLQYRFNGAYWSSTEYIWSDSYYVPFYGGNPGIRGKDYSLNSRCVRENAPLSLSTTHLMADYTLWGNNFSTTIAFESIDGHVSIQSIDNSGTSKNWLTNATVSGDSKGTIRLTYKPTEGNNGRHDDVTIILATTGGYTRELKVKYDNGILPRTVLQNQGQWTTGLQLTKKGAVETDWASETMQWSKTIKAVPGARQSGVGYGRANTLAIRSVYIPEATASWHCIQHLGSDWYLPTEDELTAIFRTQKYLGPSYLFSTTDNYWSSTEHLSPANDVVGIVNSSATGTANKLDRHILRCVRNF